MTIHKYVVRLACMIVIVVASSGCANVALMPDTLDAEGKRFSPPADKANIYITRTSILGGAVLFQIYLNRELAGSIAPNTYLLLEVGPGNHQIAVITPESQHAAVVNAIRGENYFLDVVPKMGFMHAQAQLQALAQEEGKKAVQGAQRAELLLLKP